MYNNNYYKYLLLIIVLINFFIIHVAIVHAPMTPSALFIWFGTLDTIKLPLYNTLDTVIKLYHKPFGHQSFSFQIYPEDIIIPPQQGCILINWNSPICKLLDTTHSLPPSKPLQPTYA